MFNRQNSIDVLGFDPYTQEYKAVEGLYELTPEKAAYILKNHNNDNRAISKGQKKKLGKSIDTHGYQDDGDALRFNKEGNITEYQHRLLEVVDRGITVHVPLVLGVEPAAFTKTAGALPRGPFAEISRIDKKAIPDESTVLGVVIKYSHYKSGKGLIKELTLNNASSLWPIWKKDVRKGISICETFFNNVQKISKDTAIVRAWATMMGKFGYEKEAKIFLKLLQKEILGTGSCTLTREFIKLYEDKGVTYLSNTNRPKYIWCLLCVAASKIIKKEDGIIEMNVNFDGLTHDRLKSKNVKGEVNIYRKFLVDPDGIGNTPNLDEFAKAA